jgi:lysophospholipid acyltransferase (LPLAT)-like uncharacterized protein
MGWIEKNKNRFLGSLGHLLIGLLLHSCRLRIHGAPTETGRPGIFIFWHRHLLYMMFHFRHRGAHPLISLSQDGEMISTIASKFGMKPIRGSSSRGGARALLTLIDLARKATGDILITADGPRGPLREVKPGLLKLAQKSGAPLIPVCWRASRRWVLHKSWDHFVIPKPFCRIDLFFGEPMNLTGISEEKAADLMKTLEKKNDCI